ncbi:hypothetical protein JCM3766R1_000943, partial [Sporobolomyces carnicolor]
RLKRFPVHKSFWQSLQDASRRGDSIGDSVSSALVPSFRAVSNELSKWFFSAMADRVVESVDHELSSLGLGGGGRGRRGGQQSYVPPGLHTSTTSSNRWFGTRWEMGK